MPLAQLITAQQLAERLEAPALVILDCRFALEDIDYGQRSYAEGHIAGRTLPTLSATSVGRSPRA